MKDYFLEIREEEKKYAKIDKWAEQRRKKVAEKIIRLRKKQNGIKSSE